MRTMVFLLMAILPSATRAQNGTPVAANANAQPGQGRALPGGNVCGHSMDTGTFIDARAQNASHEEALVMRWLDAKGPAVHSGLFMGRCVAKDGDTIDSKIIVRVLPNSVAVSNKHGLTAWEAEYWEFQGEEGRHGSPHRGVFNENRFVTELDPAKASEPGSVSGAEADFRWNEESETLAVKTGIALVVPGPRYVFQPASTPCVATPAKPPSLLDKIKKHAEQTLQNQAAKADTQISKGTNGNLDAGVKDTTTTAINEANQPSPCTPAKGPAGK
jgi:hypothetical protein